MGSGDFSPTSSEQGRLFQDSKAWPQQTSKRLLHKDSSVTYRFLTESGCPAVAMPRVRWTWDGQLVMAMGLGPRALTEVGELHSLTDWQVSEASEDAELEDFCHAEASGWSQTGPAGRQAREAGRRKEFWSQR